jgi:hypothetical protein
MCRKNVVRLSAEQKIERLGKHLTDRLSHRLVEIGDDPAAILEAADRIFVRPAWCLHDSIEAYKCANDDLPHFPPSFVATVVARILHRGRPTVANADSGQKNGEARRTSWNFAQGSAQGGKRTRAAEGFELKKADPMSDWAPLRRPLRVSPTPREANDEP